MTSDDELNALTRINKILGQLDSDGQMRCLSWLTSRYGQELGVNSRDVHNDRLLITRADVMDAEMKKDEHGTAEDLHSKYPTVADILAASPTAKTESHRFLLAAYWHINGNRDNTFKSREVNTLLTDVGYKIKTVGNAVRSLKGAKPALIIQCGKNATSKNKTTKRCDVILKLTETGINEVERMLNHE